MKLTESKWGREEAGKEERWGRAGKRKGFSKNKRGTREGNGGRDDQGAPHSEVKMP